MQEARPGPGYIRLFAVIQVVADIVFWFVIQAVQIVLVFQILVIQDVVFILHRTGKRAAWA